MPINHWGARKVYAELVKIGGSRDERDCKQQVKEIKLFSGPLVRRDQASFSQALSPVWIELNLNRQRLFRRRWSVLPLLDRLHRGLPKDWASTQ